VIIFIEPSNSLKITETLTRLTHLWNKHES